MTADPHIATIQAALRRERLHIEMSDLDKGHEAREFARIDAALQALEARGAPWATPGSPLGQVDATQLRESLAEYAHEAWSGWMKYLFGKGTFGVVEVEPGLGEQTWTMPSWAIQRWARQMDTPYAALPESEKESDRQEADRMLAIMQRTTTPATVDGVPEDVLHWLDVVTTAILDRHEQYSPAIGIATSALVDWMLEQRRAAP